MTGIPCDYHLPQACRPLRRLTSRSPLSQLVLSRETQESFECLEPASQSLDVRSFLDCESVHPRLRNRHRRAGWHAVCLSSSPGEGELSPWQKFRQVDAVGRKVCLFGIFSPSLSSRLRVSGTSSGVCGMGQPFWVITSIVALKRQAGTSSEGTLNEPPQSAHPEIYSYMCCIFRYCFVGKLQEVKSVRLSSSFKVCRAACTRNFSSQVPRFILNVVVAQRPCAGSCMCTRDNGFLAMKTANESLIFNPV